MRNSRRTLGLIVLLGSLALSSCSVGSVGEIDTAPAPSSQAAPATLPPSEVPTSDSAIPLTADQSVEFAESLALLEQIEVKGRAPKTGYDRDLFGKGWKDPDRNGCDARNDILARDLTNVEFREARIECVVLRGVLNDPYSGKEIPFTRGQGTSTAVQIDHVVALSDAWQKGAQQWDAETRLNFANDPLNLMAVDGPTNAAKGDKDAATWLPPNRSFRCSYVSRQTQVKAKYQAWMTQAEHEAISKLLRDCL